MGSRDGRAAAAPARLLLPLLLLHGPLTGAGAARAPPRTGVTTQVRSSHPPRDEGWWPDIGTYAFDLVDSELPAVRRMAAQGMVASYNFNKALAAKAWAAAASLDPDCAVCHWGVAYAHAPFLNAPILEGKGAKAAYTAAARKAAAVAAAKGLAGPAAGLVAAIVARLDAPRLDAPEAAALYRVKATEAAGRFPNAVDLQVLAAEAVMLEHCDDDGYHFLDAEGNLVPALAQVVAALGALQGAEHPLGLHLLIHATEMLPATTRPGEGAGRGAFAAEKLRERFAELGAGHLQHMPSHVFLRTGRYAEAVAANERAHATNLEFLRHGVDCYGLEHNAAFLARTAGQGGLREAAVSASEFLYRTYSRAAPSTPNNATVLAQLRVASPLTTFVRFGLWDDVLGWTAALPEGWPYSRALAHFARGLALAHNAPPRPQAAARELDALLKLDVAGPYAAMATMALRGALALATGTDPQTGLAHLRRAVDTLRALPYDEPPTWFMPLAACEGQVRLDAGDAAGAYAAFAEDLQDFPEGPWALHGMAAAMERLPGRFSPEAVAAVRLRAAAAWHGGAAGGAGPPSACPAFAGLAAEAPA